MKNYLEFEKEIKALEQEVDNLKSPFGSEGISEVDTQKIKNTQNEINEKLKETYANLNSWQRTQVARHEDRPKANFYIKNLKQLKNYQEFSVTNNSNGKEVRLKLKIPGKHNALNATAAYIVAKQAGINTRIIKDSLSSFWRSFKKT